MTIKVIPAGTGFERLTEAVTSEYSQLIDLVRQALRAKISSAPGNSDYYVDIRGIWPDRVVASMRGRLYAYAYAIAADNTVTVGEGQEVVASYQPVSEPVREAVQHQASAHTSVFREAADGSIGVTIIRAGRSINGAYYPDATLREAVASFEGVRVFVKSDEEHEKGRGKAVEKLIGGIYNVRFTEGKGADSGALTGTFKPLDLKDPAVVKMTEAVKRGMQNLLGLSIDAVARTKKRQQGRETLREAVQFVKVHSVDLIVEPGAGGGLDRLTEAAATDPSETNEGNAMPLWKQRMLEAIKAKDPKKHATIDAEKIGDDELVNLHESVCGSLVLAAGTERVTEAARSDHADDAPVTRAELQMLTVRQQAGSKILGSKLPQIAKDKLVNHFGGLERFTEAQVDKAIRVGPTFATATLIDQTPQRLYVRSEALAGTRLYWVPVSPGNWYAASGDTRFNSDTGMSGLALEFFDGAGLSLGATSNLRPAGHDFLSSQERRNELAVEATAPNGAVVASVAFVWSGYTPGGMLGLRYTKAEQGRFPVTPYTSETSDRGAVAAVRQEAAARASAIEAEAVARTTLAVRMNGVQASIEQEAAVRADETGKLSAKWGLKVVAGNKTAGILLNNDGQDSDLVVLVDRFAISTIDAKGAIKYPFVVGAVAGVAGVSTVGIDGNLVVDGTITARAINVNQLSAITSRLGYVTAGRVDIAGDGVGGCPALLRGLRHGEPGHRLHRGRWGQPGRAPGADHLQLGSGGGASRPLLGASRSHLFGRSATLAFSSGDGMPRFRCLFDVDTDLVLPDGAPEMRFEGRSFLTRLSNAPRAADGHVHSLQAVVIGPSESMIDSMLDLRAALAEQLDLLAFSTKTRFKIIGCRSVIQWDDGLKQREIFLIHYSDPRRPPAPELHAELAATVNTFLSVETSSRVGAAIRAFRYGCIAPSPEEQVASFFRSVELIAEEKSEAQEVVIVCPKCRTGLCCTACGQPAMRKPMAKQAIEELIEGITGRSDPKLNKMLFGFRNGLTHGRRTQSIEKQFKAPINQCVETLASFAWTAISSELGPKCPTWDNLFFATYGSVVVPTLLARAVGVMTQGSDGLVPRDDEIPTATTTLITSFDAPMPENG